MNGWKLMSYLGQWKHLVRKFGNDPVFYLVFSLLLGTRLKGCLDGWIEPFHVRRIKQGYVRIPPRAIGFLDVVVFFLLSLLFGLEIALCLLARY